LRGSHVQRARNLENPNLIQGTVKTRVMFLSDCAYRRSGHLQ
jgi:hypothetical protein